MLLNNQKLRLSFLIDLKISTQPTKPEHSSQRKILEIDYFLKLIYLILLYMN